MKDSFRKLLINIHNIIGWKKQNELDEREIEGVAKGVMKNYKKTFEDLAKYDREERKPSKVLK